MLSLTATFGLVSFGALIMIISVLLRLLGAVDVAKGLMAFTGVAVVAAFAITYIPSLLLP